MKITPEQRPEWEPRKITITFETLRELNSLGALLNVPTICSLLRDGGVDPDGFRDAVRALGGDCDSEYERIRNGIVESVEKSLARRGRLVS